MKTRETLNRIAAPLLAAGLAACAIAPLPPPDAPQPEAAFIGVRVEHRSPYGPFGNTGRPDAVFFARLSGTSHASDELVRSNFRRENRYYLLNAEPGTYVLIGAFMTGPPIFQYSNPTRHRLYYAEDIIRHSRTTLAASSFAYVGRYEIRQSFGFGLSDADPLQSHYQNLIAPGANQMGFMDRLSGEFHFLGSMVEASRDEAGRAEFVQKAAEDLAGSAWVERLGATPAR